MEFEVMLRNVRRFCKKMNISEELTCNIYQQKLLDYLLESGIYFVTVGQLSLLEYYCPGFRKNLKSKKYSSSRIREVIVHELDKLEEAWQNLQNQNIKTIRENEVEVAKGFLYGITILPLTDDERYECFKQFFVAQIKKKEQGASKGKYYIPDWELKFFNMFFPEYMEMLKNEKIPSRDDYEKYLKEKEELECQIAEAEKRLAEIPKQERLSTFELNGVVIEVQYE